MSIVEDFVIRQARPFEEAGVRALQARSLRALASDVYGPDAIESFIRHVGTLDVRLITDGTLFVVERDGKLMGCGGWTPRADGYGSHSTVPSGDLELQAATVRSIYVDPAYARQGLGSRIMYTVETSMRRSGYSRANLIATINGMPLYQRLGYRPSRVVQIDLPDGLVFKGVAMSKQLDPKVDELTIATQKSGTNRPKVLTRV